MAISSRNPGRVWRGTLAELTAYTSVKKAGDIFVPSDSAQIRISDGINAFDDLLALPVGQATTVTAHGNTTDLTAIAASYADLAEARTSVNTLRTDAETRIAAAEAKTDAVIAALKTAGLMAS